MRRRVAFPRFAHIFVMSLVHSPKAGSDQSLLLVWYLVYYRMCSMPAWICNIPRQTDADLLLLLLALYSPSEDRLGIHVNSRAKKHQS